MAILLRMTPFLAALLEALIFWYQRDYPSLYPWLIVSGMVIFVFVSLVLSWGRLELKNMLEKMMPVFLLLLSLSFGLLLVESAAERLIMTFLVAASSFVALDLLFLLSYRPASYPVNGLSHLNIAFIPVISWYAMSTSAGLMTFLHSNRLWHVLLGMILGVILFRVTGHPGATRTQNSVWTLVGGLTGLEVGLMGLILPVSLNMQGLLAAIFFTATLRARRYLYDPKPPRRLAISEAIVVLILFSASLLTARWL
ncbi:MAG: hypothetical protein ABIB04_01385 [Patescibacteria group bacterium]